MTPTPKPGRPPNGDKAATAHIHLRVTPERKNRYVKAARHRRQTLAAWMTETCDKASDEQ